MAGSKPSNVSDLSSCHSKKAAMCQTSDKSAINEKKLVQGSPTKSVYKDQAKDIAKSFQEMKPSHFLRTNLNEYFDNNASVDEGVAFQECLKDLKATISYKYPKKIASIYEQDFFPNDAQMRASCRGKEFNYDKEKNKIRSQTGNQRYREKMQYTTTNMGIEQNRLYSQKRKIAGQN